MTFKKIKQNAKAALKGKWGTVISAWVVYMALTMVFGGFLGGLAVVFGIAANSESLFVFTNAITPILSMLLFIPMAVGLYWLHLDVTDGKEVRVRSMFQPFNSYWKIIGAYLLVMVYTFLWSLLFLIPGIVKGLAYSQTYNVLRDQPELTISEAITESRRLMDGQKWRYVLFNLSFILWWIPAVVTYVGGFTKLLLADPGSTAFNWGIGLILFTVVYSFFLFFYFTPYLYTAQAGYYRSLKNKE